MNFQEAVLEKSQQKPVLVDFWAPWCAPCRTLGPVLEELADEQADRWELVKVNTEDEQDLAMRYGIRGIPNVKLFHRGEVVAEFSGALPKFQVERWLAEHLPDDRDDELTGLLERLARGEDALSELQAFVLDNPDHAAARLALADMLVWQQPQEVGELLHHANFDAQQYERAQDINTLAELMLFASDGSKAGAALEAAQTALRQGDGETGIRHVIDAVMADKQLSNELPRRAAIALFHAWGDQHELTKRFRRLFDMALY